MIYIHTYKELQNLNSSKNQNDQVKEDEMGRTCGIHGGEDECIWDFAWKARRKETIRKT
jgi:hypothetical protein